jgi:hypothetical protein
MSFAWMLDGSMQGTRRQGWAHDCMSFEHTFCSCFEMSLYFLLRDACTQKIYSFFYDFVIWKRLYFQVRIILLEFPLRSCLLSSSQFSFVCRLSSCLRADQGKPLFFYTWEYWNFRTVSRESYFSFSRVESYHQEWNVLTIARCPKKIAQLPLYILSDSKRIFFVKNDAP